jgi:hypothetical protein
MSKMTLKTEGDTHVIVTRRFTAPPEAVYRAHTDPKLIQKWLLGPEGWTMPVCINEAKPGGKFRYGILWFQALCIRLKIVSATLRPGRPAKEDPMSIANIDPKAVIYKLPDQIHWIDDPMGAELAVLQGNPSKPGLYVMLINGIRIVRPTPLPPQ